MGARHAFCKMKMKLLVLILTVSFCLPFAVRASPEVSPALVVMIEGNRLHPDGSNPLILVAAWMDGRIVWSEDQKEGGRPLLEGRIDPERIGTFLRKFEQRSVFEKEHFRRSWLGPDSRFHLIYLRSGEKQVRIETWHELAERNPNLVVENGSITPLRGRDRQEVIAADTEEFREFREVWEELRKAASDLIPEQGVRMNDPLEIEVPRRRDM
jgi:hypothetical protein